MRWWFPSSVDIHDGGGGETDQIFTCLFINKRTGDEEKRSNFIATIAFFSRYFITAHHADLRQGETGIRLDIEHVRWFLSLDSHG